MSNPRGMDRPLRRLSLDALRDLNEIQASELGNPEKRTRIAQYELAFRMQTAVPEVMDISRESRQVLDLYGAQPGAASFANNCLLARRLVEEGVRFVQPCTTGAGTSTAPIRGRRLPMVGTKCRPMDHAVTALIRDLKSRGLLEETLVIWGGEFGRSPFREGRTAASANLGRDHHPFSFTLFMAGGGLRHGMTHGTSDEWVSMSGTMPSMSTTSRPPSSTCSASRIPGLRSVSRAVISASRMARQRGAEDFGVIR